MQGLENGQTSTTGAEDFYLRLNWDSALSRHQERPSRQAQGSQNLGMETLLFYEAVTSLLGLVHFCLKKYMSGIPAFSPQRLMLCSAHSKHLRQ